MGGDVGAILGRAGFSIDWIGCVAFDAVEMTRDLATDFTDFASLFTLIEGDLLACSSSSFVTSLGDWFISTILARSSLP